MRLDSNFDRILFVVVFSVYGFVWLCAKLYAKFPRRTENVVTGIVWVVLGILGVFVVLGVVGLLVFGIRQLLR
jgi:hypothetical protein